MEGAGGVGGAGGAFVGRVAGGESECGVVAGEF